MKKLSLVTLAISGLLFASISANAQNGSRNMQRRNQQTQVVPYDQGNTVYNNGNRGSQNDSYNAPYNQREEQYDNRNGSYGRNDRRRNNERHNRNYNRRGYGNYNSHENNRRMKHGRNSNCY